MFLRPIERRVKSWLTPMEWFLRLLYWYPTLFLHSTGVLWGASCFLTASWTVVVSRASVFPWNINNTSVFRRKFPIGLPLFLFCLHLDYLSPYARPQPVWRLTGHPLLRFSHLAFYPLVLDASARSFVVFTTPRNLPLLQFFYPLCLSVFSFNRNPIAINNNHSYS